MSAAGLIPWSGRVSANDTVNLAVIGCNGMGFSNLRALLTHANTRCVALCDIDDNVLDRRAGEVAEATGTRPKLYKDYRALLDDADVDAVVIGTPDHWHCLQMVDACDAGKHVYVEKPLANSIDECQRMVDAANRAGTVVQVGQWQRSGAHWREAMEYVWSGALGEIRTVKTWAFMNWMGEMAPVADTPVPAGVDYDMWLGPAPQRSFNSNRFHFHFRWFWDYAGGLMTDWGVHLLDIALWGMKAAGPRRVMSSGGKFGFPNSAMETPDTQQAIYEFDDFTLIWEHAFGIGLGPFQRAHGVAFTGNNATLVVDRAGWEVIPERDREGKLKHEELPKRTAKESERGLLQHTENFLAAIREGTELACDVRTGSESAVVAHLGNVALRTGDTLDWQHDRYRFKGHRAANRLLRPKYRSPWRLPA